MDKIIKGVLKYRMAHRLKLLEEFKRIRDNPQPLAVCISCMDSRIFVPQFTSAKVGDMFIVRNAGNLVPHSPHEDYDSITTEPGALELSCIRFPVKDIIICGHSDCKAMNLLLDLRNDIHNHSGTPLECWVKKYGGASLIKYNIYERQGPSKPLHFTAESPNTILEAFIDPENQFAPVDKFSQINCLQQLQNISSYPFIQPSLLSHRIVMHAMWFDVYTGDVYLFSRTMKRFLLVDESTTDLFMEEMKELAKPPPPPPPKTYGHHH